MNCDTKPLPADTLPKRVCLVLLAFRFHLDSADNDWSTVGAAEGASVVGLALGLAVGN
jgi:hypothetical protein